MNKKIKLEAGDSVNITVDEPERKLSELELRSMQWALTLHDMHKDLLKTGYTEEQAIELEKAFIIGSYK